MPGAGVSLCIPPGVRPLQCVSLEALPAAQPCLPLSPRGPSKRPRAESTSAGSPKRPKPNPAAEDASTRVWARAMPATKLLHTHQHVGASSVDMRHGNGRKLYDMCHVPLWLASLFGFRGLTDANTESLPRPLSKAVPKKPNFSFPLLRTAPKDSLRGPPTATNCPTSGSVAAGPEGKWFMYNGGLWFRWQPTHKLLWHLVTFSAGAISTAPFV